MMSEKNTKQELLDEYKKLITEAKTKKISIPDGAKGLNSKNNKTEILNAIQELEQAVHKTVSAPVAPAAPVPEPEAPKLARPAQKPQ